MLLTKDVSWKVRRTVAASICHVAKALNADIIVSDLFPVFDSFCRSALRVWSLISFWHGHDSCCRDIDEVKNVAGALRAKT
jgi:hypothetical protein